jgi:hypothetical protein
MPATNFYPALSTLIPIDGIPNEFGIFKTGLQNLFGHLYFSDLQTDHSAAGDAGFYSLKVRTYKRLALEVPGTNGLALVFNPDFDPNSPTPVSSSLPVAVSYEWPILKYYKGFKPSSFSFSSQQFYDLLLDITGASKNQLLYDAILLLIDDADPVQKFVDDFNTANSPVTALVKGSDPDPEVVINDLAVQLTTNGNNYNVFEVVFADILSALGAGEILQRLEILFSRWLSQFTLDNIKQLLIPRAKAVFNINFGLEFPLSILRMVDANGAPVLISGGPNAGQETPALLVCNGGHFALDTKTGFHFDFDYSFSFVNYAEIKGTGLYFNIQNAKIDLSRKTNIPEVDAEGRPKDFTGVYIEETNIHFPAFWNRDATNSTASIKGRNLIIGTGGLSGLLSLESSQQNGAALFRLGDPADTGRHFQVGLTQFAMEFKQGAIVQSNIAGYMKVPGFKDTNGNDAQIDIAVHIGQGNFSITASQPAGIVFRIPNALDLVIRSVTIGRENNKWFLEASGSLLITASIPGVGGDFLKQPIDIKKIRIWQDGSIEFSHGGITLPTQLHLRVGPVSLALTHISFTAHEAIYQNQNRQYLCFGFNGSLNTGPGGVAVRGDGVEFHFTRDNLTFHSYLRISGIGVDIKIPGNASAESADVLLSGYLAMRNGPDANGVVQTAGPEYQGAITFKIKPLKIAGKGAMIMRPKVPAFIVDMELELSTPISLGATGLGIYGFRGLIGSHYVASRPYIGISEEDSWYEYLKKKVPPTNKQGITIEKFDPARKGFSVGIGATIATMGDNGWTFSSKVFVLLSMPEMLLIEGQANVLHKRLGIESESDPPFYAFIVVDSNSVQAGIGVNYKLPDDGSIMAVRGEMQLGFFFGNSSAWYVNIGKDLPEEKRLQARLLTLFNAYAYLMINSKGIKAGAGAKFDLQKRFGPVRVGLYAFIDARGFISFRPIQLGGAIQLGGGVYIKVGRFGIELYVAAGLSAEAPKPFAIQGFIQIKLKIVFIKINIKLEFTWIFNKQVNTDEVKVLDPADFLSLPAGQAAQYPFKAINMMSEEGFPLKYLGDNLLLINPQTDSTWNNYIIPMDSYIDFEFKRPVKPYKTRYGGGVNPLPQFTEYVAPQKGRMPQVKHTFSVENVEIKIWNATANTWEDYNPWEALTRAFQNVGLLVNTSTYDFGYWQYNNVPGKYTSLRLLSQTPFSVSNGTAPENLGILSQHILCQGDFKGKICQYWNTVPDNKIYPGGVILRDRQLIFRSANADASIGYFPNPFGIDPSLKVKAGNTFEIYFKEPVPSVDLRITCMNMVTLGYYKKVFTGEETLSGMPAYEYELISQADYFYWDFLQTLEYSDPNNPVAKIVMQISECNAGFAYEQFWAYWWNLYDLWNGDIGALESWQQNQIATWLSLYGNAPQGDLAIIGLVSLCQAWNEVLNTVSLSTPEHDAVSNWIANYCGRTDANAAMQEVNSEFDNILANVGSYPILYLYVFRWRQTYFQQFSIGTLDYCSLYLHEVCWYTEKDWEYNLLLQQNSQSVINTGINALSQAINQALPPVWRPDSSYAIVVTTKDDVNAGGASNVSSSGYPYTRKFAVGFKTAGSLGFFHETQQQYLDLKQQNKADQYKLSGLRHYIDYQRSYPNADGKLINAKPLYYKNPKLGLFFTKPYVYEFFTKWDAYKGNPVKEYQLLSVIMDPVDRPGSAPAVPPVVMGWQVKMGQQAIPIDAFDIETISNILTQGNPNCTGITNILKPPTVIAEVQRTEIKPRKLYRALFKAVEVDAVAGNKESIVHAYAFETSRYGDFTEHIESYTRTMTDAVTGQQVTSDAFFSISIGRTGSELATLNTKLQQVVSGTLATTDPLFMNYASIYDRIITGILQLPAMQAATGTEFNVIKTINTDTNTTTILGILVKSPEPFNDPKLPPGEMENTLSITDQVTQSNDFIYVFANDNASIFITNPSLSLPANALNITFRQILYNGITYSVNNNEVITVSINPGTI